MKPDLAVSRDGYPIRHVREVRYCSNSPIMTAKKEGLKELRVSVIPLTDDEVRIWQLAENKARKPLSHEEQLRSVVANYETIGYDRKKALKYLHVMEHARYGGDRHTDAEFIKLRKDGTISDAFLRQP